MRQRDELEERLYIYVYCRLSRRLNVVREKKKEMIGRMINGEMRLEDIETCDAFSQVTYY